MGGACAPTRAVPARPVGGPDRRQVQDAPDVSVLDAGDGVERQPGESKPRDLLAQNVSGDGALDVAQIECAPARVGRVSEGTKRRPRRVFSAWSVGGDLPPGTPSKSFQQRAVGGRQPGFWTRTPPPARSTGAKIERVHRAPGQAPDAAWPGDLPSKILPTTCPRAAGRYTGVGTISGQADHDPPQVSSQRAQREIVHRRTEGRACFPHRTPQRRDPGWMSGWPGGHARRGPGRASGVAAAREVGGWRPGRARSPPSFLPNVHQRAGGACFLRQGRPGKDQVERQAHRGQRGLTG